MGIVGAGFMGRVHLAALAADGIAVSVMDPHPERAAGLAATHGAAVSSTLDELLGTVDVVDVCAPTHRHAEIAIAAARAGRHVICEKPLARTLEDAQAIIAACAQSGVRLFVAQVVRYFPVSVYYPLVYWMLMAVVTAVSTPRGLLGTSNVGAPTRWRTKRE